MKIPGRKEVRKPPQNFVLPDLASKKALDDFLESIGGSRKLPKKLRPQVEARAVFLRHREDMSERKRLRSGNQSVQNLASVGISVTLH